jgi:vacuolar-type H+-ATPase subunit H
MISGAIESAQEKIEGFNFDARHHLLEYDDVLNKHREIIYKKRRDILDSENVKDNILEILKKAGIPVEEYDKKEKELNFRIHEKDVLFWIFYVLVFGELEYEKLKPITIIQEKKIKIEFIEKCRLNKSILKTYKFATLSHIENFLLNENKIDLNTFFSLCAMENKCVFYLNKNTYFELLPSFLDNESSEILLLTKIENPNPNHYSKFSFQILSKEKVSILDNYRNKFYKIELFHKPVKAISNYKLSELKEFGMKLGLEVIYKETGMLKKKMELYEQFVQYF